MTQPQAILVLPHLRIQNANAIASPLTHGFPSITAFTGVMWALERKLAQAGVPLQLHGVGVVCHHHQEQVTQGYVRNFNLTRNPVGWSNYVLVLILLSAFPLISRWRRNAFEAKRWEESDLAGEGDDGEDD